MLFEQELDMLDAEMVGGVVEDAIAAGNRNENALTNLEFFARHPERNGAKIQSSEKTLAREWAQIRDDVVRPALTARASLVPLPAHLPEGPRAPAEESEWTAGRILKYSLGGVAGLLFLGWAFNYREQIAVEAKAAGRHVGQLAGRAKSSLRAAGAGHRAVREGVVQERQAARITQKMGKAELVLADRRVNEATIRGAA